MSPPETVTDGGRAETAARFSDSVLRIPVNNVESVEVRFALLAARDKFDPKSWPLEELNPSIDHNGVFEIDLEYLRLADGEYEYEFVLDRRHDHPVADPYAEEITKFGGYRGIFRMVGGKRWRLPFCWDDEFPGGVTLAKNHQLVVYEMPLRWMESAPETIRQVGLGTFEKVAFMRLDELRELGINAIELLPVQDSADTLNWGYGTRFFFAPDFDMGGPVDLKFFVKQCHRRGIRVLFDIVMNHDRDCPLRKLDYERYFLHADDAERSLRGEDYGEKLFRYWPSADGECPAREFHFQMAEYWIRQYHADGFRIDEFRGINNWDFIQQFRDHAWHVHQQEFPGRPFLVIAEDSGRRAVVAQDNPFNPHGRKVTDAIWNFAFRDEARRAVRDDIHTVWGQPPRRDRVRWMISGEATWDNLSHEVRPGFYDMAQAVNYLTSHDVEKEDEKRIMNHVFGPLLREHGFGHTVPHIRWVADHLVESHGQRATSVQRWAHGVALERLRSAFGLLLTSVGIPMILAGDEFGDVHDLDHTNWRLKMSDPVDWQRRDQWQNNRELWNKVRELIRFRTSHPALLRKEVDCFYFHPAFDQNDGARVFAYCRSRDKPLGRNDQVVVIANLGPQDYPDFQLPWHWRDASRMREIAPPTYRTELHVYDLGRWANVSLAPFQTRVFAT